MVLKSVTTSAPGKIILSGEHAVVYGTEAIACAIDIRTTCTAKVSTNCRQLRLSLLGIPTEKVWNIDDLDVATDENYDICWEKVETLVEKGDKLQTLSLKVVLTLYLLIAHRHLKKTGTSGLTVTLRTDLPIGGGLGSSGSMGVALASCLLVLCGDVGGDVNMWTSKDVDVVNKYAYAAEQVVHGAPSGIDNMTITSGHFLSFKGGKISYLPELNNAKLNVLIVNTKQPRSTKLLVEKVRKQKEKFPQLYSSVFRSIGVITEYLKESLIRTTTATNGHNVVDEVVGEIEELCDMNQALLECIGVGHEDITRILKICKQYGLHGKLTGAGGGGCLFVVLPQHLNVEVLNEVVEQLTSLGYQCFNTLVGAPGVQVIQTDT